MFLLIFLIVLSILILVHEFGHFIVARKLGIKVERFSLGFGPKIFSIKGKETEYCVSLLPLGGYIKMAGESPDEKLSGKPHEFLSRKPGERFWVLFAGPFLNYVLAFLIFCFVFMMGSPTLTSKVGEVLKDYPAYDAGIKKGDRIVAIDGKDVKYWEDITQIIHKKLEGDIILTIEGRHRRFGVTIKPEVKITKNILGQEIKIAMIGIAPSDEIISVKYPPFKAIALGGKKLWSFTSLTYKAIYRMLTGGLAVRESLTGPVGIFFITREATKLGFVYLLQIMALISASLAIFNFLPIPVLDGGHVIFLAIEKIRGKPLSPKVQERIVQIFVYLLIALAIFIIYNDLVRFGVFQKITGIAGGFLK